MANEIDLDEYDFTDLHNYPNIGVDKDGNIIELSFNGNVLLRPFNSKLFLTEEAEAEIEKCANSYEYFAETYCKILTLKEGVINIKLRDYQKEFLKLVHNNRFILSAQSRRAGKTTTNAIYIVWNICFKKDYMAGIAANRADLTIEIVSMIKDIYQLLPPFLQHGVKKWNARSIELSNGSKVKSSVMSANSFRGLALSYLLVDETAWIDSDKYEAFQDSVIPTLATSDNTKIIKISTPNGLNHFYKEVEEAKNNQNGYIYFEVTWRDIETYTQEWADEEIKRIGITKFNQNYNVKFLGSSSTLLNGQILGELIKKEILVDNFIVDNGKLYEDYNPNYIYAITVDSSKTVGKTEAENDYICVNVLCLKDKIHQVYTYRTNEIHYTELAQIIYDIGEHFDFPLCIVENNEGSGTYTANRLIESLDYPNMYFDPKKDGLEVGIRTTSGNRGIGLTTLKKLIENYKFIVNDSSTIDEFSTFIKVGKRYEAQNGSTDDCIMSLNLLMYVLMDENNDLEITIDDYLQGEIEIKESEESENDVDFVGHVNNGPTNEEISWLHS